MHVDSSRRVSHIRGRIVVEVSLFDLSILQRDRSLRHQLKKAEGEAALDLTLDREGVDRETPVNGRGAAMNGRSSSVPRPVAATRNSRTVPLVDSDAGRVASWQRVPPLGALVVH